MFVIMNLASWLIAAFGVLAIGLASVDGRKRCPHVCGESYTPICGHDAQMGYLTFCGQEGLDHCNTFRKRNFSKIADGPCYPSVRDWSAIGSQDTTVRLT